MKNINEIINCQCYDRDHLLIAEYVKDSSIEELYFNFVVRAADYQYSFNIFKRLWWRIKTALKVLFLGEIKMEDTFILMQKQIGSSKENIELNKFINFLNKIKGDLNG